MLQPGPLLINLGVTFGAGTTVMLVAFAVGVRSGRHRVADIFWGLAIATVAVTGHLLSAGYGAQPRRCLVTALTVVWALRLSAHVAWRGCGQGEDPRYDQLLSCSRTTRNRYALRVVYLLQAGILWFVSWPVQVAQYDPGTLGPMSYMGAGVWAVGLFFEAAGDAQLHRFRANPKGRTVLDTGLWRYTRHPNYFGDACVWWGLWLIAADNPIGLATVICPTTMTWLLWKKTGVPLLESRLIVTRKGYAEYLRRTSEFIPWPPNHHR